MPVRKIPRYGAQKNIGKFSSVKTGRVAWYESLLERDYMYLLDFDPDVSFWHEQPLRFRYTYKGKKHFYTPDMEVHRGSKKQIVEVKSEEQVQRGKWDYLFRIASSICELEGYEFIVVTDRVIRQQPKLDTVKKLWKYARTPVLPQHQVLCKEFFQQKQTAEVELSDLLKLFGSKSVPTQCLYALLFWGALEFDLTQPLDQCSLIRMSLTASFEISKKKGIVKCHNTD